MALIHILHTSALLAATHRQPWPLSHLSPQDVAARIGETAGGLLNATFGNVAGTPG